MAGLVRLDSGGMLLLMPGEPCNEMVHSAVQRAQIRLLSTCTPYLTLFTRLLIGPAHRNDGDQPPTPPVPLLAGRTCRTCRMCRKKTKRATREKDRVVSYPRCIRVRRGWPSGVDVAVFKQAPFGAVSTDKLYCTDYKLERCHDRRMAAC